MTQFGLSIAAENLVFLGPFEEEFMLFGGSLALEGNLEQADISYCHGTGMNRGIPRTWRRVGHTE